MLDDKKLSSNKCCVWRHTEYFQNVYWYSVSKLLFNSSSTQSYSSPPYCTISFSLPFSDSPLPFPCHQRLLVFCALYPSNRDFRASLLPHSVSPGFSLSASGTLWAIISHNYLLLKMSLLRAFLHCFPHTYSSLKTLTPPSLSLLSSAPLFPCLDHSFTVQVDAGHSPKTLVKIYQTDSMGLDSSA
jgi:hypothetical protein